MSNDPYGQSVPEGGKDNTFPTTTVPTVVGNVRVADKSYNVQGQVVDSTNDNLIDVNAIQGVTSPPDGDIVPPSTGYDIKFETNSVGPSQPINENPEQTFLPRDENDKNN